MQQKKANDIIAIIIILVMVLIGGVFIFMVGDDEIAMPEVKVETYIPSSEEDRLYQIEASEAVQKWCRENPTKCKG